jgi:hypothetical protein
MADSALFVGWGPPVRGREEKGLGVFNEALAYWGKQQEAGAIESFDVTLLYPHGGDLAGFLLIKASDEQITALRADDEYRRINTRAAQVVENLGIVDAVVGDGIGEQISLYQDAINELV